MPRELTEQLRGDGVLRWNEATAPVRYRIDVYENWLEDGRGGRVAGGRHIEASATGGAQLFLAQAYHAKAPLVLDLEDGRTLSCTIRRFEVVEGGVVLAPTGAGLS